MTDWRGIPGNKHGFERLQDLLQDGQAISFVGAGASAGLYPLWGELITNLATEAINRGRVYAAQHDAWLSSQARYPDQVVHDIKHALGDGVYATVLNEMFRQRPGPDGNCFTPTHAALLRLPFKAHVTTNFDPGLLEARLALRPDLLRTGYATWMDGDIVQRWNNDEIFKNDPCPILFAHGAWERSDSIVLGTAEYRRAYSAGAFRRLFLHMWTRARLVFVGFSFLDAWVGFIANEVLNGEAKRTTEPRHVALIGLPETETYTPFMRNLFTDKYDAEPIFYPIIKRPDGSEDHSALLAILTELDSVPPPAGRGAGPGGSTTATGTAMGKPPLPRGTMAERWSHETTEDEHFTGRTDALKSLNRWAADPTVRVIGVTGMGGLGKTSLIGYWLKHAYCGQARGFSKLFFWSFYAERDVAAFSTAFVDFLTKAAKVREGPEDQEPGKAALAMLRAWPTLLVLDGLEVLQEQPEKSGYGGLLIQDLHHLLDGACRLVSSSLVVLTSRFPFLDLKSYLGDGFRALDLDCLAPSEGAEFLEVSGVGGSVADREMVSRKLEGHPLGLRLFALTLEKEARGDPTRLVERVFDMAHIADTGTLEGKLSRLLLFYEQRLPRDHVALLGLVSIFNTRVLEATLLTLSHRLPEVMEALGGQTDAALSRTLGVMGRSHLLLCDPTEDGSFFWSCHPVLRDHFRRTLLGWGKDIAVNAAGWLTDAPSRERATSITQLQPVLTAIELLLDAGDFISADRLYRERLDDGQIFKFLSAPSEGLRCARGFVRDATRRRQCEEVMSKRRFGYRLLDDIGLFATHVGEFDLAQDFLRDADALICEIKHREVSVGPTHQSQLMLALGKLDGAEAMAREGLARARVAEHVPAMQTRNSLSCLADALAWQGRVGESLAAFEAADKIQQYIEPSESHRFYSIRWITLLARLGSTDLALERAESNLAYFEDRFRLLDIARCHLLLGVISIETSNFPVAMRNLEKAEAIFRRGHVIQWLPKTLLAQGELERRQEHWESAAALAENALRLAATRGMRLDQADALVLRARVRFAHAPADSPATRLAEAERASDDLDAALALARDCGCAWVQRDALSLLAEVHHTHLGTPGKAATYRHSAEVLSHRLLNTTLPTPNPYAFADAEPKVPVKKSRRR